MSLCGWVVALPLGRRGHHRTGDVGLTARATTQECTQIGKNGPSGPLWGICVHCWSVGLGCGWPWDRNSVHKWEDRASPRRFGAFVYTVAPCEDRASDRGDAVVYTDRRKWPLGAVLGHSCTLLRRESRYESRRELRQVARAPQPPRRAGGAPSLAPLAWSERQALREWRRCQVGIFAKASTHTNPRRALFLSACHSLASSGSVIAHPVTSSGTKTGRCANKMRLRELV